MQIGDNLKYLRTRSGLSRKEAANALGIAFQTLGHWENSRSEPPFDYIDKMTKLYNTSISEIFGETIPTPNELDEFISGIIQMWKKDGTLNNIKSFDDLDSNDQQILKSVINKLIKNKDSN